MLQATFRPLDHWPRKETPATHRKGRTYFRCGWGDTLSLLEQELSHLKAHDVVVQIDTDASQIRNDGWPRSDARVRGPRAALSFGSRHGSLTYHCDDCSTWEHNLRCIALTLQRLRTADMYGVTKRGEQYTGFKQLPGGIELGPVVFTIEKAAGVLANLAGEGWRDASAAGDLQLFQELYRKAVKRHHPDAGGDRGLWQRLQEAAAVLKKKHGVS